MESPQLSSRLPFFQRLFCCGRRALSSKQYASNYRNGDENFGVAAEKDGVRNKLQSFGYVPRDLHYLISCRLTACLSVSLIESFSHSTRAEEFNSVLQDSFSPFHSILS